LIGGYFGTWLDEREAAQAALLDADLRARGAKLGARAIVVLPVDACGICETASVLRYLADSTAGQCGPCVHGLDAVAGWFERLAACDSSAERSPVSRWIAELPGRGACRHPDGAAALAASALEVFAEEVELHLRGHCPGDGRSVLPVPTAGGGNRR
jgi:NADH:ubiquinone oxidoreductase subunit F (NADH-binding)